MKKETLSKIFKFISYLASALAGFLAACVRSNL